MKATSIVALSIVGACIACAETQRPATENENASDAGDARVIGATYHDGDAGRDITASLPSLTPTEAIAPDAATSGMVVSATTDSSETNPTAIAAPVRPDNSEALDVGADGVNEDLRPPLGTRNFACQPSESPMFQSQELLQMRISGDFTRVNTEANREDATTPGSIDPDGPGPLEPVPVAIRARGRLRYLECGYRPFKVVFEEKQKDNAFRKLGKSVKFSTHCGDREDMDPLLQASSLDEYYQRVRMEHAAYQIVDTLETLSLKTRLVELTYHDTATNTEETHLAFVREPEDEMAQRCDMVEGEDIPTDEPTSTNYRAELLLFLVNNFILQSDVKNKLELRDLESQASVLAPYDFDLVGIFRREFFKLRGRTLDENNAAFADWLRRNQSPELHEEVDLLLARSEAMQTAIEDAGLNPENYALFREWFTLFTGTLRDFQACRTAENDPTKVACHVPDDYPNAIADATLVDLGEHTAWLEPPGDKDFVSVELEGGKLYSFVTRIDAQLFTPDGQPLQAVPAAEWGAASTSYSLRPASAASYHVEFDHGESLVCSDMWAIDLNAQYHAWAFYEDDHGNTPDLATSLSPGGTTNGMWELDTLQSVFDDDWFRLDVTEATKLTLHFEGSGAGRIDSFKADAPEVPIAYFDLFPPVAATSSLDELFPEPGSYLIRILQDFGDGTYALEVE